MNVNLTVTKKVFFPPLLRQYTVRKIDRNFHILDEKSKFTFGIRNFI